MCARSTGPHSTDVRRPSRSFGHTRIYLTVTMLATLGACEDNTTPAASSTSGSQTSGSTSLSTTAAATETTEGSSTSGMDLGQVDETTSEDSTGSVSCVELEPGDAFELAANSGATRIHPHVAADSSGAWFSFVHPEPSGSLFDVSLMHLRCADDVDIPPQVVNTAPGNDIDASVAVSSDRVLVVWNSDDGTGGSSNLQIHGRVYSLDGTPLAAEQFRVTTSFGGQPIAENHTFASVTATTRGFSVAGLRAHPLSPAFVAFSQSLDRDGGLIGEAFGPPVEMDISHGLASASSSWLAYGRSGTNLDQVWLASPDTAPAPAFEGLAAQGGHVLHQIEQPSHPLVAAALGSGASLDIGVAAGLGPATVLGEPGALEHNPTLAQSPAGGLAVVFHRNIAGLNNAVVFQRLELDATTVQAAGEEVILDTESPPYPPSITWTQAGWLVTWSRGSSPNFSTWGRVLEP